MDSKERKEYQREYMKKYNALPEVVARAKAYRQSARGKAVVKKYQHSKKGRAAMRKAMSKYYKNVTREMRAHLIALYSNETSRCVKCGGKVEHLHHTDPAAGKAEKLKYGNASAYTARKHQIMTHVINPNYMTPLCGPCHRAEHQILRRLKANENISKSKCVLKRISSKSGQLHTR